MLIFRYAFFRAVCIALLLVFLTPLCAHALKIIPRTAMSDLRQTEAQAIAVEWKSQKLFSTPVQVNIKPINPDSEAASTQHETFFEEGVCHIVVYVDPVHGTPTLPGIPTLAAHEHILAFETVVMHELSHCAHFARGLRYDNPLWDAKYNNAMSVQMVMAQQMYNETRFVDAQMEHVADAHAAIRMRQLYNDSPRVQAFLAKYFGLRDYWLGVASSRSGDTVYIQHATQAALRWGITATLTEQSSPQYWFDRSVQEASITALANAKKQVAWGGLGALLCASSTSSSEWSSTASNALARIAANDITFMPPGPWRVLPLDFKGAVMNMEGNREVFVKTAAVHALQDLDELRTFVTGKGMDPIPMDADRIGRPEGVIPMELAVGAPTLSSAASIRQANGCVAINPKD